MSIRSTVCQPRLLRHSAAGSATNLVWLAPDRATGAPRKPRQRAPQPR
ncbi:hypothetical protein [Hymenobacter ruber]